MTRLLDAKLASERQAQIFELAAIHSAPTERTTPDQWGANNRVYPPTTGKPGQRDPGFTPYVIPFERGFDDDRYNRVVLVTGAQSGKTDAFLDIIGERCDTRPVPLLYVGPSKDFLTDQFEPRLMGLFDEAAKLADKVARGKRMKKTLKRVAGITVRLAHAGSSTALKSDPAGLALVDEYDEMLANIKGQGDPLGLVEARGITYVDFVTGIASTPSSGLVETEIDQESGLEMWEQTDPDDVGSPIWRLWQEGTRHHWAWRCPHCREYFIPRFKLLTWPKNATPAQARRSAYVQCPYGCAEPITDAHKEAMNAEGVFVAPGQRIGDDGTVIGDPPDTSTLSFWVSGLASPFVSFGKRAEDYLKAVGSGEQDKIQTAINAGFGEVFAPGGGDVPEWAELAGLKLPYAARTVPDDVQFLTMGIDVQRNRLPFVIRGWGARAESWLIDYGNFVGDTAEEADLKQTDTAAATVWDDLAEFIQQDFDGLPIKAVFIDSGFRPGKKFIVPEHRVYAFARRFPRLVFPTKGYATINSPTGISLKKIEVTRKGEQKKFGQTLVRLNSDKWKSWVHERIRYPVESKGAFHLHEETLEDYFQQIVSEVRVLGVNGRPSWIQRSRENHYLDCEALAAAAAYQNNAHRIGERGNRPRRPSSADRGELEAKGAVPAGVIVADGDRAARIAAKREAWARR
jgi:phage terminase large subunit GpA-like protein